jgi:hypothetical protein
VAPCPSCKERTGFPSFDGLCYECHKLRTTPKARLAHVPQLSIRYLMLWTFTTAAALFTLNLLRNRPDRWSPWEAAVIVPLAIAEGWVWMAMALIVWHKLQRTLWKLEPGEWLLVGPVGVAAALPLTLWMVGDAQWRPAAMAAFLTVWMVHGLALALYVRAAATQPADSFWTALHSINALGLLAPLSLVCGGFILIIYAVLLPPLGTLFLICAVVGDHRRRAAHHWLHCSGVGLYGIAISVALIVEVIALYAW